MPTVFVTQIPHKRDKPTARLVPALNINPAHEFGQVRIMMPPQAQYQESTDLVHQLMEDLSKYSYEDGDSLLLLGDTTLIAITVGIVTMWRQPFAVLRWDRLLQKYVRVVVDVSAVGEV